MAVGRAGVEVAEGVLIVVVVPALVAATVDEDEVAAGVPLLEASAIAVCVPAMISFIN